MRIWNKKCNQFGYRRAYVSATIKEFRDKFNRDCRYDKEDILWSEWEMGENYKKSGVLLRMGSAIWEKKDITEITAFVFHSCERA